MARIEFWPVCNKCGRVLKCERVFFSVIDHAVTDPNDNAVKAYIYDINPSKCPYCGEMFEGVSIPNLPFDPSFDYSKTIRWSNGKFGRRYRSKTKRGCV